MIDYELADQLCDADFPKSNFWCEPDTGFVWYPPTLSELIEALPKHSKFALRWRRGRSWIATAYTSIRKYKHASGDSPEEAVARLWLALNKK